MNKITLIGRLTKAAALRYTAEGKEVLDINLAVDDGYGDNKKTIWFRCSLWGKRAVSLEPYMTKGQQVYIEGWLNHEDGNPRVWGDPPKANFEIFVLDVVLLGGKKQSDDGVPF